LETLSTFITLLTATRAC